MNGAISVPTGWPTFDEVLNVFLLQGGYNTTVVMLGVCLLGMAAGTVGTFAILRKHAMMSDTLSHATLPGIGIAFLVATALQFEARSLPILLAGATVAGICGVLAVHVMTRNTRLPEDAAMGAVLSVFFGLGFVILSYIQTLRTGSEGGLSKFIYGQTAAMSATDAQLIGAVALVAVFAVVGLFKEFRLVCFDAGFAQAQGWPTGRIDLILMALVVIVTVVGLQAVGLILIISLIIIPAAAARFWTEGLRTMVVLAALFGAASGYCGAAISALVPRLPAGGIIVLVAGFIFLISMFLAPKRGVLAGAFKLFLLRLELQDRLIFREIQLHQSHNESHFQTISLKKLAKGKNIWGFWLYLSYWSLYLKGFAEGSLENFRLTEKGWQAALQTLRNDELWQAYFFSHQDFNQSSTTHAVDPIESIVPPELIARLEAERLAHETKFTHRQAVYADRSST